MKELLLIPCLFLASCSASTKIARMNELPGCLAGGGIVAINTEKPVPAEAIPALVKFPLDAIPEAKAAGLKGDVQLSLAGLQSLEAVCKRYEAIARE